jgi:hypothetical protein
MGLRQRDGDSLCEINSVTADHMVKSAPRYIYAGRSQSWRSPQEQQGMNPFDHASVVAHFFAGNRVELIAIDGTPPPDPENGDAEYYRVRAILAVARQLRRGNPSARVYAGQA